MADGLALYKEHVNDLADCDATVQFTHRVNNLFDLMNGRRPVEGIRSARSHGKRDRIKVCLHCCMLIPVCFVFLHAVFITSAI